MAGNQDAVVTRRAMLKAHDIAKCVGRFSDLAVVEAVKSVKSVE